MVHNLHRTVTNQFQTYSPNINSKRWHLTILFGQKLIKSSEIDKVTALYCYKLFQVVKAKIIRQVPSFYVFDGLLSKHQASKYVSTIFLLHPKLATETETNWIEFTFTFNSNATMSSWLYSVRKKLQKRQHLLYFSYGFK